jgi:hypothetical protein
MGRVSGVVRALNKHPGLFMALAQRVGKSYKRQGAIGFLAPLLWG